MKKIRYWRPIQVLAEMKLVEMGNIKLEIGFKQNVVPIPWLSAMKIVTTNYDYDGDHTDRKISRDVSSL